MHPTKEIIESWPKPNYVNPVTRGPALTIVNIIFITLVILVVGLRYYTRLRITRSFGQDDVVIGLSLIPTFALTVVVLVADNHYGWNRHSWDLHAHNGPHGYKLCLSAQVLFFWAATLNKMSLLLFYKRLTGPCTPLWYRRVIVLGLAFHAMMLTAFFLVAINACKPLSAFWTPLATYPHHCIDEGMYMMSFGIITVFLDFFLLLLPIPIVWSLDLAKKQRIAVCCLFFIGFIVCIAGIVQIYYVNRALVRSYDETWEGWPLWICSAVEVDLGILCVSVPAIRPLLAIYIPRLLESSRPPVRDIKNVDPASDLSDLTPSPPKTAKSSEKQASSYFSPVHNANSADLERGSRHTTEEEVTFGIHS